MAKTKQNKLNYIIKYGRKNYKSFNLKLRFDKDKHIIDYLNGVNNRNQLLKKLVVEHMNNNNNNN